MADLPLYPTDAEVSHLETALPVLRGHSRIDGLVALAWALRQRDSGRAVALAAEVEASLGDGAADRARRARIDLVHAETLANAAQLEDAQRLVEGARQCLRALDDAAGDGDGCLIEAAIAQARGDMDHVIALCAKAAGLYAGAGDGLRQSLAEAWRLFFLAVRTPATAADLLAAAPVPEPRHPALGALVSAAEGAILSARGELARAVVCHARASELAREAGLVRHAIISAINAGGWLQTLGDYDGASELIAAALAQARPTDWPAAIGLCLMRLGELLRHLGQLERSREVLTEALSWLEPIAGGANKGIVYAALASTFLEQGRADEALAALARAKALFAEGGHREGLIEVLVAEARALSAGGHPAEAIERIAEARRVGEEHRLHSQTTGYAMALAEIHRRHRLPPPPGMTAPGGEIHYLEEALACGGAIEGWTAPVGLLTDLSRAWEEAGDVAMALAYLRRALAAQERAATRQAEARALASQVRAEAERARLGAEQREHAAALALRRSEESFRYLFETNPLPMWVLDRESWRFIEVNEAAVAAYGYGREAYLAMGLADLRPADEAEDPRESIAAAARLDRAQEARLRRSDGVVLDVELFARRFAFEGRRACLVLAVDVTRRKSAEQQTRKLQKLDALGQLTGGIAHDFNNLLGIIIGNLELLQERVGTDPDLAEMSQMALESAYRGAELTGRLLAFARKQPLAPRVIDLNRSVAKTVAMLRRMLPETITTGRRAGVGLWPVRVDPAQVEDALLNLAINARDAMPAGGRLHIETDNVVFDADDAIEPPEMPPGDYVMLAVTDTGCGMPKQVVDRAFEPFFTTKEPGQGTGLGLSQVYGFIKQSGGNVKIYSEVGIGTTIRIYLPRTAEAAARAGEGAGTASPTGRERILVVEDNEGLRGVARRSLAELGYSVLEAADAAEALEILNGTPVDLIFTDMVLPGGMDGLQLLEAARRQRAGLKGLLATGYSAAIVGDGSDPSAPPVIRKPYRKNDLASRIRAILDAPPP